MKKYILCFLAAILLIPSIVYAKEVNFYDDLMTSSENVILNSGDVVKFHTRYSSWNEIYHIYIDGNRVDNNYYVDDSSINGNMAALTDALHSYTIQKKVFLSGVESTDQYINSPDGRNKYYIYNMKFISYDEKYKFYNNSEITNGQIFTTNDVIHFDNTVESDISIYIYDKNRNLEYSSLVYTGRPHKNLIFPEINGENAYWRVELFEDGLYTPGVFPHFYQLNYQGPQFTLKCNDKVINYGKKTTCHLYVTSMYEMSSVAFDMDLPNFKISNITLPEEVKNMNGTKKYNFNLNDNYATNGKEVELMSFDLEGTKNENYTDGIDLIDINYKDEILDGSYQKVTGQLQIIPNVLTNPQTLTNLFYILLPIMVLLVALSMIKLAEKEGKKKI